MTTAELIERTRDILEDYGELDAVETTDLRGAVSTTITTAIPVKDSDVADQGDFIYVDNEAMEVMSAEASPPVLNVRRAARGTTAATHSDGAVVRVNMTYHNKRILDALNGALGKAYPTIFALVTDDTTYITDDTTEYTVPATIDDILQLWIEDDIGDGNFTVLRTYEPLGRKVRLYGAYTTGTILRFVGTARFTRLAFGGNLDSDFPDHDELYDYLVQYAVGTLLMRGEARTGRDEARATASTGQYVNLNIGNKLRTDALQLLQQRKMRRPAYIAPRPDARYF